MTEWKITKKNTENRLNKKLTKCEPRAHSDYLDLDGENDELIMKLIYVKSLNKSKTNDEIDEDLRKLKTAHPDLLVLDGVNDEIISRLSRLKPVESDEPDPDIEFMQKRGRTRKSN